MDDFYKKSSVITLIKTDFDNKKVVNKDFKNKNGLIVFYAPWCSHCQAMIDMWKNIATTFKYRFIIGAVNVEDVDHDNGKLLKTFNIGKYPTIKYVTKTGNVVKYTGVRTEDDLLFFIWNKM